MRFADVITRRPVYQALRFLVVLFLTGLPAGAATGARDFSVQVPKLVAAPHLRGVIDRTWANARSIDLGWDFTYRRASEENTTVYLAQYGRALYVAWDVHQQAPLTINQQTNGAGVYDDDHVAVVLYPQGAQGFTYIFRSNPIGTRDQFSSENSAYSPQWQSRGRRTSYGYVITMRVPLDVIRSGRSHSWRVQFTRKTIATNEDLIWAYGASMQSDIDVNYAGTLTGIDVGNAQRPPARVQLYGLGKIASENAGGSTSRIGADLSLPISPTASLLATLHPDYSNVEIDQQSISPQEFPRFYQEVRPFFTQLGQQFNTRFNCWNCVETLYTPSIPAFGQGYAVEGTRGPLVFGAFDALGPGRIDDAQALTYNRTSPDYGMVLGLQQVSVDAPNLHDVSDTLAAGYGFSHNHAGIFANIGTDRGTLVTDARKSGYQEAGLTLGDPTTSLFIDYQHIGSQFQPVDGYVSYPGISGLSVFASKTYNYSATSKLQQLALSGEWDRYHDESGLPNQQDQSLSASLRTRSLFGLTVNTGSSYLRTPSGELLPFTQEGAGLSYRQNTATATNVSYSQGEYYHGFLGGWFSSTGVRLARPAILSLEVDTTHYVPHDAYGTATQWNEISANELLERASVDWQFSHAASLDLGVRRLDGIFAPTGFGPAPIVGTPAIHTLNLTAAFHFLALRNEFYVVFGNPNELSTEHALFVKWIRYIGAPKGT